MPTDFMFWRNEYKIIDADDTNTEFRMTRDYIKENAVRVENVSREAEVDMSCRHASEVKSCVQRLLKTQMR